MTGVINPQGREVLLDQIHQEEKGQKFLHLEEALTEVVAQLIDHLPVEDQVDQLTDRVDHRDQVVDPDQPEAQDLHQEEIRKIQEIKNEKVNILSNSYSIYVHVSSTKYY